jgi:hypothetical protein
MYPQPSTTIKEKNRGEKEPEKRESNREGYLIIVHYPHVRNTMV